MNNTRQALRTNLKVDVPRRTHCRGRHSSICGLPVRCILALLLSCMPYPVEALTAPVVAAFFNSQGSFSIHANNLNRMIEAEIMIGYQSDDQSLPLVSGVSQDRSATSLNATSSSPGSLVIQFKSKKAMSGNVPLAIARISGKITSLTALLRYENGTTAVPLSSITNPSEEQLVEASARRTGTDLNGTDRVTGTAKPVVDKAASDSRVQTLADAASQPPVQPESTEIPPRVDVSPAARKTPVPGETVDPVPKNATFINRAERQQDAEQLSFSFSVSRRKSLLDHFSESAAEPTAAALARLLERSETEVVQEPPLLLSDGAASLRVTISLPAHVVPASKFIISGGHCHSLQTGENGTWILEITPQRGVLAAAVTVLAGKEVIEFPLTVAPPLELFDAVSTDPVHADFVRAANELILSGLLKQN